MSTQVLDIVRRHTLAAFDEIEAVLDGQAAVETQPEPPASEMPLVLNFKEWKLVGTREGEKYDWPTGPEYYTTFHVFEGRLFGGTANFAIGECEPVENYGRPRRYFVVFHLGPGGGKSPIVAFLEADDYADTKEYLGLIRGKDHTRAMFGPDDDLPGGYQDMRVEVFRDRISAPDRKGWNRLAVVAGEDDFMTMLEHAAIQWVLRGGVRGYLLKEPFSVAAQSGT